MQATIDRIDDGVAVLIPRSGNPARITIPATLLPKESREGNIVSIVITPDTAATDAEKDRVSHVIQHLNQT